MGFVDKNDQILTQHSLVRKCTKWTTKVFFHLFEESLFKAHILYKASAEPPLDFNDFKITFVKEKTLALMFPVIQSTVTFLKRYHQENQMLILDNIMFVII